MGNKASRAGHAATGSTPRAAHVKVAAVAPFTQEETEALHQHFTALSGSSAAHGQLAISDLKRELGIGAGNPAMFLERVLALMDGNSDGLLTFEEFCAGVAAFGPTLTTSKIQFTFRLYDTERKGAISPANLKSMLGALLKEYGVPLADAQLDRMVSQTFAQFDTNHDGLIDAEEYKQAVITNPSMLKPLTIAVGELLKAK